MERMTRAKERRKRRNTVVAAKKAKPEYVLLVRSCSLSYLDVIQSEDYNEEGRGGSGRLDRFSMPPLPDYSSHTTFYTPATTPRESQQNIKSLKSM